IAFTALSPRPPGLDLRHRGTATPTAPPKSAEEKPRVDAGSQETKLHG
uniref:Uncharacterized protein n=1 Tax=Scophthalmus maximus TaxID=52904 RepID=A0A8D3AMZ7_SCOMX